MAAVEEGGQQVTLLPWPQRVVHPVRLERAAACQLSYAAYVASLEQEDAEEGVSFDMCARCAQLSDSCSCASV